MSHPVKNIGSQMRASRARGKCRCVCQHTALAFYGQTKRAAFFVVGESPPMLSGFANFATNCCYGVYKKCYFTKEEIFINYLAFFAGSGAKYKFT
jgi:hypothetical protein